MDRLWRSIENVSVAWFDRDTSYMLFFFTLGTHFEMDARELGKAMMHVCVSFGKKEITLAPDLGVLFAQQGTLYVRTDFSPEAVRRLTRDHATVTVSLVRESKPHGKAKKFGRRRSFVPVRAAHVPGF